MFEDFTDPPIPITTYPSISTTAIKNNINEIIGNTNNNSFNIATTVAPNSNTIPYGNGTTSKPVPRKGGIIFPSVKNKPSVVNSSFATDSLSYKDVKVNSILCTRVLSKNNLWLLILIGKFEYVQ